LHGRGDDPGGSRDELGIMTAGIARRGRVSG